MKELAIGLFILCLVLGLVYLAKKGDFNEN